MSPRQVVGYEGEGRARRPVYRDEVIDASPMAGLPVGSPEAAAAIERVGSGGTREVKEAKQALFGRESIRPALNSPEHLQQSRLNGARRHQEVAAARRAAAVTEEAPPMAEEILPAPDPAHAPSPFLRLSAAALAAEKARLEWEAARIASLAAETALEDAIAKLRNATEAAWPSSIVEGPLLDRLEEIVGEQPFHAAVDEARASVALDGETQVMPEEIEAQTEAAWAERETEAVVVADPELSRLTTHQQRVLEATVNAKGDRRAVMAAIGANHIQSIDVVLEGIGRKGLLPPDLIPLLPARFAKYSAVPA